MTTDSDEEKIYMPDHSKGKIIFVPEDFDTKETILAFKSGFEKALAMKDGQRGDMQVRKENKNRNSWELFYPDGTSSLMNYDTIKQRTDEILKMIENKIEYYLMPLKEKLKLKIDFETGEAGHKIVVLKELRLKIIALSEGEK